MLDNLATRYHLLPSQVLQQADSLDVMVMDVAEAWARYRQEQQQARDSGQAPPAPNLSINKMQDMIKRVRQT